ncbi:MAG TPA: hypothetical protein VLJ58_13230, partial [Ramlibacter sp.]|nr:hypothetical protein [Ramlibacter sp.]
MKLIGEDQATVPAAQAADKLISNDSFESGSTGWALVGDATLSSSDAYDACDPLGLGHPASPEDPAVKPPQSFIVQPKTGGRARLKPKPAAEPRLSRQRKPEHLSADDWQRTLRRQFGREQGFELRNLGDAALSPVFSEFRVSNRDSGGHYRVTIRGSQPGDNLCTCLDFATNDLGTC